MKIFVTCPNPKNPHGGLKIIFQLCEQLQALGHEVGLHLINGALPTWYTLKVPVVGFDQLAKSEAVILTSPHSAHYLDYIKGQKCFLHLQMREDLFRPQDHVWLSLCEKFYTAPYPLFSISHWVSDTLRKDFQRSAPIYQIENGIDKQEFPVEQIAKDGKTILIEGIDGGNPTKDVRKIAAAVGLRLKREGYRIIAYSQFPLRHSFLDEYYQCPSIEKMNSIYKRATILIKASLLDARSLSPLEAMTKGTVTARAISEGDDDLVDKVNCLRVKYDEHALYSICQQLLKNKELRESLATNCLKHVRENCDWKKIIQRLNEIICH